MFCCDCMMLDILLILNTCDFKDCQHSFEMASKQFPPVRIPQYHYMSVVKILSVFVYFLKFHVSAGIESYIVEHHHDFFQEIIDFDGWFKLSCNKNFNRCIVFKNIVELVEHCLVVLLDKLLASLLLILDSDWFLTQLIRQFLPLLSLFDLNLTFDQVALIMNLHSLLLILDFIGLLFKGSSKLQHAFWLLLCRLSFLLGSPQLFFVSFGLTCLLDHC